MGIKKVSKINNNENHQNADAKNDTNHQKTPTFLKIKCQISPKNATNYQKCSKSPKMLKITENAEIIKNAENKVAALLD